MNKMHGSVTTWILGSGLLLSAGQSLYAQEVTNPPLSAGRKIAGDKVFPKLRSVQPASHEVPGTLSVSQNTGTATPVQQQLEELYRRDGKQMPPMTLQQAPNTQAVTPAANAGPAPGQVQRPQSYGTPPAQSGTPYAVPPKASTSNSKTAFLNKLNPFKSKPAPAPLPPYPAQPLPKGTINRPAIGQPVSPTQTPFNQSQFNNANKAGSPQPAAAAAHPQLCARRVRGCPAQLSG